jgi:plasmid maintenance system antidote protein VapI
MQGPKDFLGEKIWKTAKLVPMKNHRPDSNEAVAERLKLLRRVVSGESQTAFAARIGIETKRWNNFERGTPLSKEVAFLLVKKFPNATLDWLWLGKTNGLPISFQRELEAAENGNTSPRSRVG